MPPNMPALYEVEGLSRKDADLYGTKILGVTTNFVQDHRAQEAPNVPAPARRPQSLPNTARRLGRGVGVGGSTLSNLQAYVFSNGSGSIRRVGVAAAGTVALAKPGTSTGPRF